MVYGCTQVRVISCVEVSVKKFGTELSLCRDVSKGWLLHGTGHFT
jgi:hypothetical protein